MAKNPYSQLIPRPQKSHFFSAVHVIGETYCLHSSGLPLKDVKLLLRGAMPYPNPIFFEQDEDGERSEPVLRVRVDEAVGYEDEFYRLVIEEDLVLIEAAQATGVFYAVQTLQQLVMFEEDKAFWPVGRVEDWPDFRHRGIMLDISRNRVPTLETLFALIDHLARWKINQLQLYTEHTFAYSQHETVWQDASPLTAEEILSLDAYCRDRFIELVPNQNSFGHMTHWLVHPKYAHLAETHESFDSEFGVQVKPWGLCPTNPESVDFLKSLYDELLPLFSSGMFNIGFDETIDIGLGQSRPVCEERGKDQVYLEFLKQVHSLASEHGVRIQVWADMMKKYPAIVPHLPKDMIALEWGYEADTSFAEALRVFAEAGIEAYVCPGTSTWNAFVGRAENAMKNLETAAREGKANGASGYLIADWGDNGHLQHVSVSLPMFMYGASLAWAGDEARDIDVAEAVDGQIFRTLHGTPGMAVMTLANLYRTFESQPFNANTFFHVLHGWDDSDEKVNECRLTVAESGWGEVLQSVETCLAELHQCIAEDDYAVREWINMGEFVRHACLLGQSRCRQGASTGVEKLGEEVTIPLQKHLDETLRIFVDLWQQRYRVGWLDKSLEPLNRLLKAYSAVCMESATER